MTNAISFTGYLLSKKEKKLGTPEKPLSELGLVSYKKYWCRRIMEEIAQLYMSRGNTSSVSINTIASQTGMNPEDVVVTLEWLNMLKKEDGQYLIRVVEEDILAFIAKQASRKGVYLRAKSECLRWSPVLHGR